MLMTSNPFLFPMSISPAKIRVAVILAAFNGIRWLEEQVNSILAQRNVIVTLFISVDHSSDGTENWFNERALDDPRIVVLPHGEFFGGAARNFYRLLRDVDFSGFDYVSFADQDDIWLTDKLLHAHDTLLKTGSDGYSSNVVAFWCSGRRKLIKKSQPQTRWDFLFEAAGPGCTYVLKVGLASALQALLRERWEEVQKVELHDWFTYAYARANNYRWVIDERAGMLYRQHNENQVGVNAGWRAFWNRTNKILTESGLTQVLLVARLVGIGDSPVVRSWLGQGSGGLLRLALNSRHCRRRMRDRLIFFMACLMLSAIECRRNDEASCQ
jgi:rhamnosyltransferase